MNPPPNADTTPPRKVCSNPQCCLQYAHDGPCDTRPALHWKGMPLRDQVREWRERALEAEVRAANMVRAGSRLVALLDLADEHAGYVTCSRQAMNQGKTLAQWCSKCHAVQEWRQAVVAPSGEASTQGASALGTKRGRQEPATPPAPRSCASEEVAQALQRLGICGFVTGEHVCIRDLNHEGHHGNDGPSAGAGSDA